MIIGIIQLMVLLYTYVVMAEAAKEGVRYAVVHGSGNLSASGPSNYTAVQSTVQFYAGFLSTSDITVTYPDSGNGNDELQLVKVSVSHPFSFLNLGWPSVTVRASAQGRIVN
jgi:hypothetical protein